MQTMRTRAAIRLRRCISSSTMDRKKLVIPEFSPTDELAFHNSHLFADGESRRGRQRDRAEGAVVHAYRHAEDLAFARGTDRTRFVRHLECTDRFDRAAQPAGAGR